MSVVNLPRFRVLHSPGFMPTRVRVVGPARACIEPKFVDKREHANRWSRMVVRGRELNAKKLASTVGRNENE